MMIKYKNHDTQDWYCQSNQCSVPSCNALNKTAQRSLANSNVITNMKRALSSMPITCSFHGLKKYENPVKYDAGWVNGWLICVQSF